MAENLECAICLQELKLNYDHVEVESTAEWLEQEQYYKEYQGHVQLECKHTFHTKCIDTWLWKNPVCPYCRSETTHQPDTLFDGIRYQIISQDIADYLNSDIDRDLYNTDDHTDTLNVNESDNESDDSHNYYAPDIISLPGEDLGSTFFDYINVFDYVRQFAGDDDRRFGSELQQYNPCAEITVGSRNSIRNSQKHTINLFIGVGQPATIFALPCSDYDYHQQDDNPDSYFLPREANLLHQVFNGIIAQNNSLVRPVTDPMRGVVLARTNVNPIVAQRYRAYLNLLLSNNI